MNATQLRQIADEAYGAACSAPDDYSRGYAAGVEALARKLAGGDLSSDLLDIVRAVQFKATVPQR